MLPAIVAAHGSAVPGLSRSVLRFVTYAGSLWYATQPRGPLKKEVRIAMMRAYFNG